MRKILFSIAIILGIALPQQVNAAWSDFVIILDPGHGGDDPGACYASSSINDYTESWLVLQCAGNVYNRLSSMGANVYMTRWEDDFSGEVELSPRRAFCYTYNSDVFVSFHLNAANASAHGTESYYYYSGSYNLASYMQSALISKFSTVNGSGGYELIDRGVKSAGYTVITAGEAYPSTLTEGLFIDCYSDWQLIHDTSSTGFFTWVDGHLKGIYDYLASTYGGVTEPTYYAGNSSGGTSSTPEIIPSTTMVELSCAAGSSATTEITLDGNLLGSWVTVTLTDPDGVFSVSPGGFNVSGDTHDFDPENPKLTVTFSPKKVGTYPYDTDNSADGMYERHIMLSCVDVNGNDVYKWIMLSGVATAPPLEFKEGWVASDKRDNNAQYGWDAEKVRNMDCKDGKLYLVYDHSYIKVVDARDGKYLYDLNNTGVEGGLLPLCDVRAFDGKIVACNIGGIDGNGNTHSLKIYVWDDNDTSLPTVTEIPYETLSANNIMRLGDYIEVGGSWDSGRLIFVHDNYGKISGVTGGTYIVEFALANGAINKTPNAPIEVTSEGEYLACKSSIRAYPTAYGWMLDGKDCAPSKILPDGSRADYMSGYNNWGNIYREFVYDNITYGFILDFNDKTYSTQTDADGNTSQYQSAADIANNYTGGHMKLLKISDPNDLTSSTFFSPTYIASYPQDKLSDVNRNTNCTGNIVLNQDGNNYVEAWVLSTGQGIAYFYTGDAPESDIPNAIEDIYASQDVDITTNGASLSVDGIEVANIAIYSIDGVLKASVDNSNSISINNLSAGIYIVSVTDATGKDTAKKVIIR